MEHININININKGTPTDTDTDTNKIVNKQSILDKKKEIRDNKKELRILENDLKKSLSEFQYNCNHNYIRECITTGPYQEYANICSKCDKFY